MTEHQLPEDEVIATFRAEDEDSGAFGQVVYSLAPGQADQVYTHFSVVTTSIGGALKLKSELDFEFRHLYQVCRKRHFNLYSFVIIKFRLLLRPKIELVLASPIPPRLQSLWRCHQLFTNFSYDPFLRRRLRM